MVHYQSVAFKLLKESTYEMRIQLEEVPVFRQLQDTIQFPGHVSFASSYTASLDVLLAG